jgi:hypothetical protein
MPAEAGIHGTPVKGLHNLTWMAAYAAMTSRILH